MQCLDELKVRALRPGCAVQRRLCCALGPGAGRRSSWELRSCHRCALAPGRCIGHPGSTCTAHLRSAPRSACCSMCRRPASLQHVSEEIEGPPPSPKRLAPKTPTPVPGALLPLSLPLAFPPSLLSFLQAMRVVDVPIYDFTTHRRAAVTRRVPPANVIIIEGILVLHSEPLGVVGLARTEQGRGKSRAEQRAGPGWAGWA